MFVFNLVLISIAISPAVGAVVTYLASSTSCRSNEFTCLNGSCISAVSVCDGNWDCDDGSDEVSCYSSADLNLTDAAVTHWRSKRQAKCGSYTWQCRDGSCITVDGRCDGKYDCPDKSDETHALCRNNTCQRNWFRCTYGACVDGTAPCNGVVECVDQSDELLARCQKQSRALNGMFSCLDGNTISASDACDGAPTCPDGSDETVAACAEQRCPTHLFQCAYGACVDKGSDCNGRNDCADGSDESAELCNRILPAVRPPTGNVPAGTNTASTSGMCLLPPYPEHGTYLIENSPESKPGEVLSFALLVVTCNEGYGLVGGASAYCHNGTFPRIPKCVRFCKLEPHISVRYECSGLQSCTDYLRPGTRVVPECQPNYFSNNVLHMVCQANGDWNRIVTCESECGRVTPSSDSLISGGKRSLRGELPWYVAIYRKPMPPKQPSHDLICGGTIISTTVVLSAGHCFWGTFGAISASRFAVATAKLYRDWDDPKDEDVQKSNISTINFTDHYFGHEANQQDDIAVLILETPFRYHNYVRRVCLDFSPTFNDHQLQEGNLGKVAGFGLTSRNSTTGSPILKVVELPYVSIRTCRKHTPQTFIENLHRDKICAGYSNGTAALCKGDSGGGLVFPSPEHDFTRYYLRGIVSTAPSTTDNCNIFTVITFTSVIEHARFINQYL